MGTKQEKTTNDSTSSRVLSSEFRSGTSSS